MYLFLATGCKSLKNDMFYSPLNSNTSILFISYSLLVITD